MTRRLLPAACAFLLVFAAGMPARGPDASLPPSGRTSSS